LRPPVTRARPALRGCITMMRRGRAGLADHRAHVGAEFGRSIPGPTESDFATLLGALDQFLVAAFVHDQADMAEQTWPALK
jgi:hypothetical protein